MLETLTRTNLESLYMVLQGYSNETIFKWFSQFSKSVPFYATYDLKMNCVSYCRKKREITFLESTLNFLKRSQESYFHGGFSFKIGKLCEAGY